MEGDSNSGSESDVPLMQLKYKMKHKAEIQDDKRSGSVPDVPLIQLNTEAIQENGTSDSDNDVPLIYLKNTQNHLKRKKISSKKQDKQNKRTKLINNNNLIIDDQMAYDKQTESAMAEKADRHTPISNEGSESLATQHQNLGETEAGLAISLEEIINTSVLDAKHAQSIEEEHYNRVLNLVSLNGMYIIQSKSDGNCFFASTLNLVKDNNPELTVSMLRQIACEHLMANQSVYMPFVSNVEQSFSDQISDYKMDGVWDNQMADIIPVAIANLFQANLLIYSSKQGHEIIRFEPTMQLGLTSCPRPSLYYSHLAIQGQEHYDACLFLDQTHLNSTIQQVEKIHYTPASLPSPGHDLGFEAVMLSPTLEETPGFDLLQFENAAKGIIDLGAEIIVESDDVTDYQSCDNSTIPMQNDTMDSPDAANCEARSPKTTNGNTPECNMSSPDTLSTQTCHDSQEEANNETCQRQPRPRKRTAHPDQWLRNRYKESRQKGERYVRTVKTTSTVLQVVVPEREVKPATCKCPQKCKERITDTMRQSLFKEFWKTMTAYQQRDYIVHNISEIKITGNKKQVTRHYSLTIDGQQERVCKSFFMSTLDIRRKTVDYAFDNRLESGIAKHDQRGRHEAYNKDSSALQFVNDHIKRFPCVESHYTRKDTSRQYLGPELNVVKMYDLYKEECVKTNAPPVSLTTYRREFNQNHNLGFHRPKKDQCIKCDTFNADQADDNLKNKYALHMEMKKAARLEKNKDKIRAKEDPTFTSATFDLQSVLYTPCSNVSSMYYSRKLSVYNLCVYNQENSNGTCFLWEEFEGKRGSCEIGTCIFKYIKSLLSSITHVSLFSYSCTGQNRNQYFTTSLIQAVKESNTVKIVDHKFLETGHTDMEVDSMHSAIERAKKDLKVNVPTDWYNIIKLARHKNPYIIISLTHSDFIDFKQVAKAMVSNAKRNEEGEKVDWMKIHWIRITKAEENVIFYSYDFKPESLKRVKIKKLTRRSFEGVEVGLPRCYESKLPISSAKKRDLVNLCRQNVIDAPYEKFYTDLKEHDDNDNGDTNH